MQNFKVNVIGLLLSIVTFTLVAGGLNVALGIVPLNERLISSGAILGSIIGIAAIAITWLCGRTAASACFALASALSGAGLYYAMSLQHFNGGDLYGALVTSAITLASGALAALGTKFLSK